MPEKMAEALDLRARREMTNKSELVRRAVLAYLSPSEAAAIRDSLLSDDLDGKTAPAQKPVSYPKKRTKKKPNK